MAERTLTFNVRDFLDGDAADIACIFSLPGGDRAEPEAGPPAEPARLVLPTPVTVYSDIDGDVSIRLLPTTKLDLRNQYQLDIAGYGGVINFTMPDQDTDLLTILRGANSPLPARQLPDPNQVDDGETVVSLNNVWQASRIIYRQTAQPPQPPSGTIALWVDTSVSGAPALKVSTGTGWDDADIPQEQDIGTVHLADGAVTTDKLADGAVTQPKLGARAVEAPNLAPGSVIAPVIGDGAVEPRHLLADNATEQEAFRTRLNAEEAGHDHATTGGTIGDDTITPSMLQADQTAQKQAFRQRLDTQAEVADWAKPGNNDPLPSTKLPDGSIVHRMLGNDSVEGVNILDGSVGANELGTDVHLLPAGGGAGQILAKQSATDGDARWQDEGGGAGVTGSPAGGRLARTGASPNFDQLVETLLLAADIDPSAANITAIQNLLNISEEDGFNFTEMTMTVGQLANEDFGYRAGSHGALSPATADFYGVTATIAELTYNEIGDYIRVVLQPSSLTNVRDFGFYFPATQRTVLLKDSDSPLVTDDFTPPGIRYEIDAATSPFAMTNGTVVTVVAGGEEERKAYRQVHAIVADWAKTGNTDPIPASKFSVDTAQIAAGAVETDKVADGAITVPKLASGVLLVPVRGTGTTGDVLTRTGTGDGDYDWRGLPSGGAGGQSSIDSLVQYVSLWKNIGQQDVAPTVAELTGATAPTWGPGWSNIPTGWTALPTELGPNQISSFHARTTATYNPTTDSYDLGTWIIQLADSYNEQYSDIPNPTTAQQIDIVPQSTSRYWRRRDPTTGNWSNIWLPLYTGLGNFTVVKSMSIATSNANTARVETLDVGLPSRSVRFLGVNVDVRHQSDGRTEFSASATIPVWNALWPISATSTANTYTAGATYVVKASHQGITLFASTQAALDSYPAQSDDHFQCKWQFRGDTAGGNIVDVRIFQFGATGQRGFFTLMYY